MLESISIKPYSFQPFKLSVEDFLPVNMLVLFGLPSWVNHQRLHEGLVKTLAAFPHLTGKVTLNLDPLEVYAIQSEHDLQFEWEKELDCDVAHLKTMDKAQLKSTFAPSAYHDHEDPLKAMQGPLFQVRLSWLKEAAFSVVGLMMSHAMVDGTGLVLFLKYFSGVLNEQTIPKVMHDRSVTFPKHLPNAIHLPRHYHAVDNSDEFLASFNATIHVSEGKTFSIRSTNLLDRLACNTQTGARFRFVADMCFHLAQSQDEDLIVGLWCNARGMGHVPRTYTGNTGCYMHVPINPGSIEANCRNFSTMWSKEAMLQHKSDYEMLKAAEKQGQFVVWDGPSARLLSVNLIAHYPGIAGLGDGRPLFYRLLTRNVAGIRMYYNPSGDKMIVEAGLMPAGVATLLRRCAELGLEVEEDLF